MFKDRNKGIFINIQSLNNSFTSLDERMISEIRSFPFRLSLEINVDGIDLYTSPELKEMYIKTMEENQKTSSIVPQIRKLVEKNKITPCWMNNGILKLIRFKLFSDYGSKSIMGFYHPEKRRIFILMDNNVDFELSKIWNAGKASSSWLSLLTLHEGMHMFAGSAKLGFLTYFQKELDMWYSQYFKTVFNLHPSIDVFKGSRSIYHHFFKSFEMKTSLDPNKYFSMVSKMIETNFKKLSKFTPDEFDNRLREYLTFGIVGMSDVNKLSYLIKSKKYDHIFKPFYDTYKKVFGMKNVESFCHQELWAPSEVISIMSEGKFNASKIKSAFSKIK